MKHVFDVLRGSQVYGTATPESDIDTLSVGCKDSLAEYAFAQMQNQGLPPTLEVKGDLGDATSMDLLNFVRLSLDGNPNMVEVWFTPEEHFTCQDVRIVHTMHELAPQLLTKRLLYKILGYARSQLELIQRHDRPTGRLGEARKAIIEKYGYDTKAAAHAFRLMYIGYCITRDCQQFLPLHEPQRQTYMEYRTNQIENPTSVLKAMWGMLHEATENSTLPLTPYPDDFQEFIRMVVEPK